MAWNLLGPPEARVGSRIYGGAVMEHAPGLVRTSGIRSWRSHMDIVCILVIFNVTGLVRASRPLAARVGAPFVASDRCTGVFPMQVRGTEP